MMEPVLDRRDLLRLGAGSVVGLAGAPAWARQLAAADAPNDRVLVLVQLKGGNDGLNTLVPHEDGAYHRARPTIRLADGLLPLDELNALHPALARLARHYAGGRVAFVQNVGHARPNLSHFRSQDIWDTARIDDTLPPEGWVGNYCDHHPEAERGVRMVAVGRDATPRAFRSGDHVACTLRDLESYRIRTAGGDAEPAEVAARRRALKALQRRVEQGHYQDAVAAAAGSLEWMARVEEHEVQVPFPRTPLGGDLELCARIIGRGVPTRFLHVAQDGYDTHTTQLASQSRLLGQLDQALDAFLRELAAQDNLRRVLVMTISDFGRRVAESGVGAGCGTDHGAASLMVLCGGAVRGGIHGGQPDLVRLDENGNQVHRIDFRQVYATVLEDWMGGRAEPVLGGRFAKLPLLA